MERWLEYAKGTMRDTATVPTSMEQLEDAIQDHREFLLEMDSHKSLMMSINVVGSHLAEHTRDRPKAERLNHRLDDINNEWDATCENATVWQTRLQTALLQVRWIISLVSRDICTNRYWFAISLWKNCSLFQFYVEQNPFC